MRIGHGHRLVLAKIAAFRDLLLLVSDMQAFRKFGKSYGHAMQVTTLFQRVRYLFPVGAVLFVLLAPCLGEVFNRIDLRLPWLQAARPLEVVSQFGPQPPCGLKPVPPYPPLEDSPVVKAWSRSALGRDWKPPACSGWTEVGFTTLVTVAGRFHYIHGSQDLLRHIGAISELTGLRYWSTSHNQWRTFIVNAFALSDSRLGQRRADFTVDELRPGKLFYFEQADNLSGQTVYRMNIIDASEDRIVFNVENASTMHYHFIPVIHPGELQSMYFLDRESDTVWRFYSIVRTGKNAVGLIARNEASSINRAVAFYRHLAGIPDTQEPPGAR